MTGSMGIDDIAYEEGRPEDGGLGERQKCEPI